MSVPHRFELNQNVLDGPGARRIIKMYNKLARTLVAFEYLWHQAWVSSIDQAKSGLQATLIIRHPEDQKLYVNFDLELLQLVREAKCLDRMGVEVPESAKIILFQEDKLKSYYNDLHWALNEYDRVVSMVIPVTAMVLRPHFNDMEAELRPGAYLGVSSPGMMAGGRFFFAEEADSDRVGARRGGSEGEHS